MSSHLSVPANCHPKRAIAWIKRVDIFYGRFTIIDHFGFRCSAGGTPETCDLMFADT
jgi:hypothetical protein